MMNTRAPDGANKYSLLSCLDSINNLTLWKISGKAAARFWPFSWGLPWRWVLPSRCCSGLGWRCSWRQALCSTTGSLAPLHQWILQVADLQKLLQNMAYCRQRCTDSGVRFVLCIFNRSFMFCLVSLRCFYHIALTLLSGERWQLLSELIVDFLTHHDLPLKRLLPKCAFTWADTFDQGFLWLLIFEVITPPEYVDAHSIQRLVATILHHQLLLSWTKTFELR